MPQMRIPLPLIPFSPPLYRCLRAREPLVPDGDLSKPFWRDAPFTEPFRDIEGPSRPAPRFATKAKMLWDDNALYIGAVLYGNEIWAHQTEHDCVIFYDNDFEIFIDPDGDTHEYIEYEMNARNTTWDLLLTKPYRDGGSPVNALEIKGLSSAVQVAGKLNDADADNQYWSVEVVIPFATLAECDRRRRPPKPGEFYRVNFSRVQWRVDKKDGAWEKRLDETAGKPLPEDNWVWAPTGVVNIHYPELWGYVFFCEGEEEPLALPPAEKVKWELRKLYYAEQLHADLYGGYTADKKLLAELLAEHSPCPENASVQLGECRMEVTTSFFELRSVVPESGQTVVLYGDGRVIVEEKRN